MKNRTDLKYIVLAVLLVVFTFPEWRPEVNISVDGSCAWLYNFLFAHQRPALSGIIFPHGPLDFLQFPLPIGQNLEIAVWSNTLLRLLFVWSGLRLAGGFSAARKWGYFLLMVVWLELNTMDVLLPATAAHFCLMALVNRRQIWFLPAVFLAATGILVKTVIGLPAAMLVFSGAVLYFREYKNEKKVLLWPFAIPVGMLLWWLVIFGHFQGFVTMLTGEFFLTIGNSSAVCHYPANHWVLLGIFWLGWLVWPWLAPSSRRTWWLLLLPVFAFWKYGISRQDIWHIHTSFRFFLFAFGLLALSTQALRTRHIVTAMVALSCFYLNLRNSEGWTVFDLRPFGVGNFYEWVSKKEELKEIAIAKMQQNFKSLQFPDSVRQIIGDRTVDIFPWHYSYAAANGFRLSPRHIPQSYAAYHPWLDALDADFFSSEKAPDFIVFHLKPAAEMGQFAGIDDRNLLDDTPETLLALLDRYQVRLRQPRYILLEKTTAHFTGKQEEMPFTDNWKTLKKEPGFWRIKARFEKTIWGRIKSLLYKDDPVFVDIFSGNITRRIKVVPALAEASGIWLSPRFEHPSSGSEPYLIADSLHWITGAGWKPRPKDLSLVWTPLSSESDFLPHWSETGILSTPARELFRQEAGVETVATGGYSSGWTQVLDSIPTQVFEISTGIQSPKNNNCCLLVLSVTDANGKAVFYDNTEYCAQGVGENVFWPVSLRTKIPPDIALPCTAKVYVWNTGSRAILCKQLAVKG